MASLGNRERFGTGVPLPTALQKLAMSTAPLQSESCLAHNFSVTTALRTVVLLEIRVQRSESFDCL